jgi:hypothetical protein
MKVETGSFTPTGTTSVILLDDDTLVVKGIWLQISPTSSTGEASTGFSDGTRHRAKSLLVTSTKRESKRSTTQAITHYKDVSGTTTLKIAGKPTDLSVPGEFEMTFSTYDPSISIDFMVVGE